jgi:hypothetical protein
LGIPADLHFDTAISFGYPIEPPAPPKKSGRRSFTDVVRWERWRSEE